MRGWSALGGPRLRGWRRLTLAAVVPVFTLVALSGGTSARAAQHAAASCPAVPYVNGFDVNQFAGTITWSNVTCEDFVYAQAVDGTFVDPTFSANRSGASSIKLPFGAIDYFQPNQDPAVQADKFLSVYAFRPGDLPPVLDLEITDGQSASTILGEVSTWASTVKAALGVAPVIYTSPVFWVTTLGNPSAFTSNPLWIANWGVSSPTVPASNWGGHGWTLWQYSGTGTVTGVLVPVALDYFSGSNVGMLRTPTSSSVSIVTYTPSPGVGEPIQVAVKVSGALTAPGVPAPSGAVTV
ncbi:MAG TPA: GH25 family lysozyme, partial [Acidimicrobiales bacterium]|nr:GH25 family lysozyme [Acidimicrobiales bacterium]